MLLAACDAVERGTPNPAPLSEDATAGAGGTGATTTGQGASGGAAPVIRTVETRALLGGPANNLLIDGDFETSIVVQGHTPQSGWIAFSGQSQKYIRSATGGHCRSGLRCAYIDSGDFFYGKGLAANGVAMNAELWARPPVGRACADVAAYIGKCNFSDKLVDLAAASEFADESGWCVYRALVASQSRATCMFIENTNPDVAAAPFIVDAASLTPAVSKAKGAELTVRRGPHVARFRHASGVARRSRPFGHMPKVPDLGRK
jgi:hypothetical protein